MYLVTVEFIVKAEATESFLAAIKVNAASALQKEEGCHQFDVCQSESDPNRIFLYEAYTDAESFAAHRETEHFKNFFAAIDGIAEIKTKDTWFKVDLG